MLYNKSLFEEKGWAVPTTNDELVALAKRIREEEPGMIPVSHCGFAVGTYWRMLGSLAQSGFLGTPEGAEWTKAFVKGEASFETGFGSALQMLEKWKEVGMLDTSDANAGNNDVYTQLMNRKAAMAYMKDGKITSATLSDGREVQPDEKYQVIICGSDYDEEAYPNGEDTGVAVSGAYVNVMDGKTLTAPDKLCR